MRTGSRSTPQALSLNRIVLYARDVERTVEFYQTHFGFHPHREDGDRIVELRNAAGGACLLVHPAAKGQKRGQSAVKLVFDMRDVEAFRAHSAGRGLVFGPIHQAGDYVFANARDPDGNPISISSRAFRNG